MSLASRLLATVMSSITEQFSTSGTTGAAHCHSVQFPQLRTPYMRQTQELHSLEEYATCKGN